MADRIPDPTLMARLQPSVKRIHGEFEHLQAPRWSAGGG